MTMRAVSFLLLVGMIWGLGAKATLAEGDLPLGEDTCSKESGEEGSSCGCGSLKRANDMRSPSDEGEGQRSWVYHGEGTLLCDWY